MCLGAEARAANKAAKRKYQHQLAVRKRNWMNTIALTHVERLQHDQVLDASHVGLGNAFAEIQEKYGSLVDEALQESETKYQKYLKEGSKGALASAAGRTGRSIGRMEVVDFANYVSQGSRDAWNLSRSASELSKEGSKAAAEARNAQLQSFANNNIIKNPDLAPPVPVGQNVTLAAVKDALSIGSSIATMAIPFAASSKKLKDNIVKIGRSIAGHNIYKFNYKGDSRKYVGVIAEEVQKINPKAVVTMPNGFLGVIYDLIDVQFKEVYS